MNSKCLSICVLCLVLLQSACSSSSETEEADSTQGSNNLPSTTNTPVVDLPVLVTVSQVSAAPEGAITHYGAISIADEVGIASDLVGSFYRFDSPVSETFLTSLLSGQSAQCDVQDDDTVDFEDISVGFLPTVPGVNVTAVSAGESLLITGPAGTYATLQEQSTAGFLFYDLPNMSMLMAGPVPDMLTVDVTGSAEIPAFVAASVPSVTTLSGVSPSEDAGISANTVFTWEPSGDPTAMIRIFTSTAGGFFLENGITVTCVTPDTGSFRFPSDTLTVLGSDFNGAPALVSRIVANTIQVDTTVFYVIRESFR